MIGKIIPMRQSHLKNGGTARSPRLARLRDAVFGLTRYIVDANPHALLEREDRILALTDYALAMKEAGVEPGEKVEAYGARNLIGDDLRSWQAQMLAVAARAPTIKAPLTHIILSLHNGEHWSEPQRDEAITIVLETLGLERCQTIWAEHSNTEHPHIHLSVVRVDPETGKAAGSDWPIDDLHQALALIEERQNRIREPNALFVARGGVVYDAQTGLMVRDAAGRYTPGGKTPAGRRERLPVEVQSLREAVLAAARDAVSWSEFHTALRAFGITYDKAGSGARITKGSSSHKASDWHRSLARRELEKRFGAFTLDPERETPGYDAYDGLVVKHLTALRAQRELDCERIARWLMACLKLMPTDMPNPVAQAMRQEARAARVAVRRAYADAIAAQAKQKRTQDQWHQQGRPRNPDVVDAPELILASAVDGAERSWSRPPHLTPRHADYATHYCDHRDRVQFTDHRLIIIVHASRNVEAIDAALQLGAERWGAVRVHGSARFVALANERARRLDITVMPANQNLHAPLDSARFRAEHPEPNKAKGRSTRATPEQKPPEPAYLRVGTAKAILAAFDNVPLRRRRAPRDSKESGCSGALMIDLDAITSPADRQRLSLAAEACDAAEIQSLLETMRDRQLERWGRGLSNIMHNPALDETAASDRLPASERAPAASACNDHDWLNLLASWQLQWEARKPERTSDHRWVSEPAPEPKAEPEDNTLALYAQWLQRDAKSR